MWTQRDQLQAFQFLRRRIVSAVQFGDANHPVAPGRRVLLAAVTGLGTALLVAGGFLVAGLLHPGSAADWRQPGQILIEKESGATLILGADGLVHPVLNYSSARLLTGSARTTSIAARSLADAPRGRPLGIPDAPASLPAAGRLVRGPWTMCASAAKTSVLVGTPLPAKRLGPGEAVLVATPDGVRQLVSDGRRYRLPDDAAVALGYDAVRPVPVSDAWLGALPAGPELALRSIRDAGDDGPRLAGTRTRIGQVLRTEDIGGQDRYYVVSRDGFVPVTQTEAALIVGNPASRAAYPDGAPRPLTAAAADVAASRAVARPDAASGFPALLPRLVPDRDRRPVLCAGGAGTGRLGLWTADAVPAPAGARMLAVQDDIAATADEVYVAAGRGLLATDGKGGVVTLITDQGTRFVVGADDVKKLGYDGAPVTPVAAGLLALLPAGPKLSAEAARQEQR